MRFQVGLECEVRGRDGRIGGGCASEAICSLAVGEDEDNARVWESRGVLSVDECLKVRALRDRVSGSVAVSVGKVST